MNAAIYARVSTAEQARPDATSLDEQVKRCTAHAEAKGWEVVETYVEAGVSGATGLADRPEGARLLADAEAGRFKRVVFLKLDRFTRNVRRGLEDFENLEALGVGLAFLTESVDTSTPSGRMFRTLLMAFAEFERERIRERMMDGKGAAARAGKWHGGEKPFGTVLVPSEDGRGHTLDVHEEEAAALKRLYGWIVDEGASLYECSKRLNAEGVTTTRGKAWTHQNLKFLLKQDRLAGGFMRSWGEEIPHPEIFTPVEFGRLQEAMRRNAARYQPKTKKGSRPYPLSGRIICGCGAHWSGGFRKKHRWYRCSVHPSYAGKNEPCDWTERRWIRSDQIEAAVRDLLWDEYFATPGLLEDKALEFLTSLPAVDGEALDAARAEVDRLEEKLGDLYLRDDLDSGAAEKARGKVRENLDMARVRRDALEGEAEGMSLQLSWWDDLVDLKKDLDVTSWKDLYRVHAEFGDRLREAIKDPRTKGVAGKLREFLKQDDLGAVVSLLGLRVQLTGYDTFEVAGWLPLDVGVVLGQGDLPSTTPLARG